MSDFDKASATSRLEGGRGLRSRTDQVDAAASLLLCSSALAFHRGDDLACLDVGDGRLMHEASGAGDIRRPVLQIGEVLTAAQPLPAGVRAGQGIEPGGSPFKPAHPACSRIDHGAQVTNSQAVVTDMKVFHSVKSMRCKDYWPQTGCGNPRQHGFLPRNV
jgi:hypothetical protein